MPFLPLLDLSPKFSAEEMAKNVPGLVIGEQHDGQEDSKPLRPRASPRNSRPATPPLPKRPRVEFNVKMDEAETVYLSSGEQSPVRGRTLRRLTQSDRSRSRSTPRSTWTRNDSLDSNYVRDRLLSRDLSATPEQFYDDTLLEPRPIERYRTCSMTEELERADSVSASSFVSFVGHRDTFALMGVHRLHSRAIYVPQSFFDLLSPYLDFESYKAFRLTCKFWSHSITRARPIGVRASAKLPVEILEKIFEDLSPVDFDAARHTCRTWMIASLEEGMLSRKIQAGGWKQAVQYDESFIRINGRRMSMTSRNWLLSKRIATECALIKTEISEDVDGPKQVEYLYRPQACPLTLSSEIDFTDLGHHGLPVATGDPPLRFDVSVCQRYLLVSKAHTIYIYALINTTGAPAHEYGGYFKAINVIRCPGRVLAVSMNTTSERLSVAALLGDRLGMVFETVGNRSSISQPGSSMPTHQSSRSQRASSDGTGAVSEMTVYNADGSYGQHTFAQAPESMGFSTGKRSVYKNVCSAQDPPRSVAICPQRRCVAFGNATGIEVHWIDALSGQDLQRWFPLSSGCGCLYFLPNRIGIDSARKLRIITSTYHPVQARLETLQYPDRTSRLERKGPWDDFTSEDQAWKLNWAFSRMSTARASQSAPEHYNAIPLSDGNAILFTDPITSNLYLGEGRLDQGLPELSRRYRFECPKRNLVPYIYNAGAELKWGARVLAAYANPDDLGKPKSLYLFTIPPDDFFSQGFVTYAEGVSNAEEFVKTIKGMHLIDVPDLTAIAIDASDGDLTIRAFSTTEGGRAFTWQLAVDKEKLHRLVLQDGITIPTVTNRTEDVVMEDADGIMTWKRHTGSFDGVLSPQLEKDGDTIMQDAFSVPRPPSPPPRRPSTPIPPAPLFFAGPTHQTEAQAPEDEGYGSGNDEDGGGSYGLSITGFAIHVPPVHGDWDGSDEWIPRYLGEEGADIEDEGLGIDLVQATRVDVQIVEL